MPFIPNTPEQHASVLTPPARASPPVCRGISNTGQPCARTLALSAAGRPASGILTTVNHQKAYFCARHQDQARDVVLRHTASFTHKRALVGRGSLDTLIEQVEVLVGDGRAGAVRASVVSAAARVPAPKPAPRPGLPPAQKRRETEKKGQKAQKAQKKQKKPGFWTRLLLGCCCVPVAEEDVKGEKVRQAGPKAAAAAGSYPKRPPPAKGRDGRVKEGKSGFQSVPPAPALPMMYPPGKKQSPGPTGAKQTPGPRQPEEDGVELVDPKTLTKEQREALKYIPSHLPNKTKAALQNELLKPMSEKDEAGYIYMFWLRDSPLSPAATPSASPGSKPPPPRTAARALMQQTLAPQPAGARPQLMLKIGRAANVQRRLHQWTAQCGYDLALIRYYPHSSSARQAVARKVRCSHRVERLIHLELAARNVHRGCAECGRVHKEWFEIDATREGVLGVDEVVKRWVAWGERFGGGGAARRGERPALARKKAALAAGGVQAAGVKGRPRAVSAPGGRRNTSGAKGGGMVGAGSGGRGAGIDEDKDSEWGDDDYED